VNRRDGGDQLSLVVSSLLHDPAAVLAVPVEDPGEPLGIGVLAHDDDSDTGLRHREALRDAHALVGPRRRHPDIRHDHIGSGLLDRGEKRRLVACGRDEIYVRRPVEDLCEDVPDCDGVIGEYDSDRHAFAC